MAAFTGYVDQSIKSIWNRITLSIRMNCLPSQIDNEYNKDIESLIVVLSAQDEKIERDKNMGGE